MSDTHSTSQRRAFALIALGAGLLLLAAFSRLLPHPPNVAPIAALALFSGFLFKNRLLGAGVAMGAMLFSDLVLGFYNLPLQVTVYAALVLPALAGPLLRKKIGVLRIAGLSVAGSLAFYLVSNSAVWLFTTTYAKDAAGFAACMGAGLPFLKNTLLGDLFWNGALFGGYALVLVALRRTATQSMTAEVQA
ncbi:MAG: DUF6580 family putative transport protein [Planctomycetota bacterium]